MVRVGLTCTLDFYSLFLWVMMPERDSFLQIGSDPLGPTKLGLVCFCLLHAQDSSMHTVRALSYLWEK